MSTSIRQRIERGFASFGHWVYRHHWLALAGILLLTVGLVSQIPKLTVDTSTEGFLHPEDPTLQDYDAFREQFGRDELILVTIQAPDIFAPAFLERLRELHYELKADLPYLDDITSLINARNTRGAADELIVEDLLEDWPETPAEVAAVRERALANPTYRHTLLNDAATITTILIKTYAFTGDETAEEDVLAGFGDLGAPSNEAAPKVPLTDAQNSVVVDKARSIIEGYAGDGFKVYIAGTSVVADVLKRSMMENMRIFMLLAIGVIGLVLFLLFRRLSGVALPLLTVVLSLLSTLGVMALAGIPIKLPTQILPSFLLAVGVGASVHLLAVFYRQLQTLHHAAGEARETSGHKERAIAYALGHSGFPILMTSLTTAAGLASFAGSEVAPIGDLGLVAAIGVLIALVFTLVLVPALLSVVPLQAQTTDQAQQRHQRLDDLLRRIADFSTGRARLVLALSAVLLVVAIAGITQVRFSHKPFEWLPQDYPVRQATDFVNENMRGASAVEVVVDAGEKNAFYEPALMQGLEQLSQEVAAIDQGELFVGKTLSLADILKETNQALNENRPEAYRIPDDRRLIAQEFLLFENSGSDDLEDFVDTQFSQARFTAKMPWVDSVLYQDFIADLKQRFQQTLGAEVEITVTGIVVLLGRTMHATMVSMGESYLIAAVVITGMMILLIGNLRIGLISMIPNLMPIVLILGLMGWLDLPLDLFTMLIGSIAIGLAVDDTIHFMHNYRRYHHDTGDTDEAVRLTLLSTGRAMLITTLVLSLGFFLFLFADLSNLKNFGLLTGLTIILALAADFLLAPALMKELHRSHLIGEDADY